MTGNPLNRQQQRASRAEGGITLLIAGAGTGKTRTLIEKIKNVIVNGVSKPREILVLTFSRKAAEEIRIRVKESLGASADLLSCQTFHSFCLGFLRENGKEFLEESRYARVPDVLDEELREELLEEHIKGSLEEFLGMPVPVIKRLVMELPGLSGEVAKKLNSLGLLRRLYDLREGFDEVKADRNLIDFEDMVSHAIRILENRPHVRGAVHSRFTYILVDEFQDTSRNNFELLRLLMPDASPNLFVVGDDWQSIYGFRDSRVEYIVRMKRYFPSARIFKLTVNYRSRKEIVELSGKFIRKNRNRTHKRLVSWKGKGGRVAGYPAKTQQDEIGLIRKIVEECSARHDGDIAVLYRNNWQGSVLRAGIAGARCLLMTMHASKGLEFHTVIIAGISDAIIPDAFSDLEEERRLLYVAMTRARDNLYLIYHEKTTGLTPLFARELCLERGKREHPGWKPGP